MGKVIRFLRRNWLVLTAGLILTGISVKLAYQERGYMAYGGEWMILVTVWVLRNMISEIMSGPEIRG